MKNKENLKLVSSASLALMLTACTTVNPYTGQNQVSRSTIGAGIGTATGAVLGSLVGGTRGALIGGAIGATTGGLIGHSMDQENEELRQALLGTGVQVRKVGNSVQLIMASDVTFDFNQSDVRSGFYPTLNSVATVFKKYDNNTITITGYTDNVGGDAYNQTLSENRARSVGDYLIAVGVPANRVFTNGMGKRNPIASNASNAGRAMNRRVVITLRPIS
ncbi:MAG TPA: OmpA family protein [Gammaproteobacteria bacterium]|nr:OmpA family protein [Gammaproteobacteria bacterium]